MKRFALVAVGIVACGLFVFWWYSDKQVVKRRTQALLDTVTIEKSTSKIARGLQAAGLDGFLASNIRLEVPDEEASGWLGRGSVSSGFRYVADQADFTRFKLEKIDSVNVDGDKATLSGILEAKAVVRGETRIDGSYRTEFTWKRTDDGWKITEVSMHPATE